MHENDEYTTMLLENIYFKENTQTATKKFGISEKKRDINVQLAGTLVSIFCYTISQAGLQVSFQVS